MTDVGRPLWPRFFHAAVFFSLFPGFATGGLLFLVVAVGIPIGAWWPEHARGHGHAEVFGWATFLVVGVAYHFLPRLRGTPLVYPGLARASFWLLLVGVAARVLLQSSPLLRVSSALLPATAALELLGATAVLVVLLATFASGPPLGTRAGFVSVAPLLLVALAGLWSALAVEVLGLSAAASGASELAALARLTSLDAAFSAFLVPIGAAMSARLFPLYFRAPFPSKSLLWIGLALVVVGLLTRVVARVADLSGMVGLGLLFGGLGLGLLPLALGVFARRRPAARRDVADPWLEPTRVGAVLAYAWLSFAAALHVASGLSALGVASVAVPLDAQWHAIGAGFVNLLVLGVGSRLLAGFAGRPPRDQRLVWVSVVLGSLAAPCRVLPKLVGVGDSGIPALAGLLAMLAVAAFWWNLTATARGLRGSP